MGAIAIRFIPEHHISRRAIDGHVFQSLDLERLAVIHVNSHSSLIDRLQQCVSIHFSHFKVWHGLASKRSGGPLCQPILKTTWAEIKLVCNTLSNELMARDRRKRTKALLCQRQGSFVSANRKNRSRSGIDQRLFILPIAEISGNSILYLFTQDFVWKRDANAILLTFAEVCEIVVRTQNQKGF